MCRGPKDYFRLLFQLGLGVVSWFNRKPWKGLFDYMEINMAACEDMWLRKLLSGLFECEQEATVVHHDNQSGIRLFEKSSVP